jgi:tRNA threonylcarbamoyladenosine biosynthesis protein TsaE
MEVTTTFDVAKTISAHQTQKVAQKFALTLEVGDIIALFGDLGAGKTVFVKGLARGLSIKKRILSPSFVFIRSYPIDFKNKKLTFHHIDLYRGYKIKDFENLGLDEIFSSDSIIAIEWADRIKNSLPKNRIDVLIEVIDEKTRRIKIDRRV